MQRTLQSRRQPTSSKSKSTAVHPMGNRTHLSALERSDGRIWALLLVEVRGPLWIAYVLFGFAMLLLLIWRPDASPAVDDGMPA
jgi:hypothetical protein